MSEVAVWVESIANKSANGVQVDREFHRTVADGNHFVQAMWMRFVALGRNFRRSTRCSYWEKPVFDDDCRITLQ